MVDINCQAAKSLNSAVHYFISHLFTLKEENEEVLGNFYELIYDKRTNLDIQNQRGLTPINYALTSRKWDNNMILSSVIYHLLAAGADINITTPDGIHPVAHASNKHPFTLNTILHFKGKINYNGLKELAIAAIKNNNDHLIAKMDFTYSNIVTDFPPLGANIPLVEIAAYHQNVNLVKSMSFGYGYNPTISILDLAKSKKEEFCFKILPELSDDIILKILEISKETNSIELINNYIKYIEACNKLILELGNIKEACILSEKRGFKRKSDFKTLYIEESYFTEIPDLEKLATQIISSLNKPFIVDPNDIKAFIGLCISKLPNCNRLEDFEYSLNGELLEVYKINESLFKSHKFAMSLADKTIKPKEKRYFEDLYYNFASELTSIRDQVLKQNSNPMEV